VIILLNGTSSAGKTTLAKALQDVLPTPYLVIGIDTVVFALPDRYVNDPRYWQQVYRYHYDGERISAITIEPYGDRLVRGMHHAVAALARAGLDVIVDHVVSEPSWREDIEQAWAGLDVLRVGVLCPLAVVEERERQRRTRTLGWARAHIDVVHQDMPYDLTADTSQADAAGCAALIAEAVRAR
jgi:chloramphenicol 3-O phosphotransferase